MNSLVVCLFVCLFVQLVEALAKRYFVGFVCLGRG